MIGADVDFNYTLSSLWSVENYVMFNPFKIKKINLVKKKTFYNFMLLPQYVLIWLQ